MRIDFSGESHEHQTDPAGGHDRRLRHGHAQCPRRCRAGRDRQQRLSSPTFREHKRTFGLVYTLPAEVNAKLDTTVGGLLREKLLNAKLYDEAQRFNIPHVTVLHIHNPDPTTPEKMLAALPKLPPALNVTLKTFYTTEAAKGAGHPWWFDLGIVKEGASFEAMMAYSTIATAALTPCAMARCRA